MGHRTIGTGAGVGDCLRGHPTAFYAGRRLRSGLIVQLIMANVTGVTLSDAANAAVALWQSYDGNALRTLQASQHGQYLASAGFARDIAFCAQTSKEGLVPQLEEQILLPVLFNSCICRDG